MQLNAKTISKTDDPFLFEDVLSVTTKYLNDYFKAFYQIDTRYYKSVTLRLRPFDIQTEPDDTRTVHLEFAGILLFSVEPIPSTIQVEKLAENAFAGRNLGKFFEALLRSDNDFLKNLQNIEIGVRDNLLSQDLSSEKEPVGSVSKTNNGAILTGWIAIMVYGVAVVAGIILATGCIFLFRCCCCKTSRKATRVVAKKLKKQTKQEKREEKVKLHDGMFSDQPPSPDKSEYSYNHNDMSMLSTDTGAMSLMSKASLGLSNYNKATEISFSAESGRENRRRSGVSVPHGQDVSVLDDVQLNGLGQIEEDDESMYSIPSHSSAQMKKFLPDAGLETRKGKKKTRPKSKLRYPSKGFKLGNTKGRYSTIRSSDIDYLAESHTDSTTSPSSGGSDELGGHVMGGLDCSLSQIKSSWRSDPQEI